MERHYTLPIGVANTGFLLDRLGADCSDLQFLRELTQNGIEAILRTPEHKGEIVWDVDWTTHDLTGQFKLSVTDTGDGMTGEQMVEHINNLSSSGSLQAMQANFGVGAKIAAATRNHAGLTYLSWRGGKGSMIHFWRDPTNGQYGLQQLKRPDGSYAHWALIEDALKPAGLKQHGTKVVLHGMTPDSNTMQPPPGTSVPSRWVARYLNTRYYRFPRGVTVKAREGWQHDRADRTRNLLRTLTGQKQFLDEHAKHRGTVNLSNAVAHWWILRESKALAQASGVVASVGHCAALWKDELYDMSSGRAATASLQAFGVIFGYHHVVIYVEPTVEVVPNTARTTLHLNNAPLPWHHWEDEFRAQMPAEIKAHMEAVASASEHSDHKNAIKDRLDQIKDLFQFTRYRPTPDGRYQIADETLASTGPLRTTSTPQDGGRTKAQPRKPTPGPVSGGQPAIYSLFLQPGGKPGDRAIPDIFPAVRWISMADQTRATGDIEDRAAKFIPGDNMLLINADFRVYADMIQRWSSHFANVPGAEKVVVETVREWFEQSLVEAVLSSNALKDTQHWSIDAVRSLLSEEGLTAVVLPRWHIEQSIKRTLGSKLGAFKRKEG